MCVCVCINSLPSFHWHQLFSWISCLCLVILVISPISSRGRTKKKTVRENKVTDISTVAGVSAAPDLTALTATSATNVAASPASAHGRSSHDRSPHGDRLLPSPSGVLLGDMLSLQHVRELMQL